MLNSESDTNYTVKFIFSEDYKYFANITVFDFTSRIISSKTSNVTTVLYRIPRGLYTLRSEMNGVIVDKVTLIDQDKLYQIGDDFSKVEDNAELLVAPKQFSSALLGKSYASSREYYTFPSIDFSSKEILKLQSTSHSSNSSLFIFLRFPLVEVYEELKKSFDRPFYADFELVDQVGNSIVNFETKEDLVVDEHFVFVALNVSLSHGLYYLIYKGKAARQIPIYVYNNWHTQFFMTLSSEPLFGSIRIFLSKQSLFAFLEDAHKYVDILLDKMQNQDFSLNNDLLEEVATGKFDSPILEIICCYIYFQSKDHKSDLIVNKIVQNIKKSLFIECPDSPDLLALNILASNHFSTFDYKNISISGTPMFRIGYETILNASVTDKNLIPQNSVNDFIAENLYFDSPYNTFKPIPFIKNTGLKHTIEVIDIFKNQIRPPSMHSFEKAMYSPISLSLEPKINVLTFALKNLYPAELFRYIESSNETEENVSWIKNSIADIIKIDKDLSISAISTELNISSNTVLRIFSEWEDEYNKII